MRIPRIYYSEAIEVATPIVLDADASNHLSRVLRLQEEHPVVVFNGDGFNYQTEILKVSRKAVELKVLDKQLNDSESKLAIHLGQVISRGDRMDFTIQKSVELGVTEITPLISERCGVKLNQERFDKKLEQWQKIVHSACEQSGRSFVPKVNPIMSLEAWLTQEYQGTRINLHPKAEIGFKQLKIDNQNAQLLIGPEGGLSELEITQARESGFTDVLMGPRVLRTETAALSALSMLQCMHGDLG
ncbi:16S rRNA (uracil(1498)-N(3))-methyltransferase [Catenovulum maritimum]|uniref:Ribosomal RNA small subunit methyltransferase E n=1 Tax=Catenovulum maritimum TaxID=1513271 RepID=A0A0J8GY30_9ALTE|nr:16S rRNA (uracil(1498)-N(3))-methyltransferase [Catenovulum maritimum]KMT66139.1 16S rRNA methyltransferase [Catenovulum maritimum]